MIKNPVVNLPPSVQVLDYESPEEPYVGLFAVLALSVIAGTVAFARPFLKTDKPLLQNWVGF